MFGFGFSELFIIFLIVLILFGAKKIPQLGSGLGEGIKNFSKSFKGDEESPKEEVKKKEEIETKPDNATAQNTSETPK